MAAGRKTGGRLAGTPNRRTQAAQAMIAALSADNMTPLEVMLACMRAAAQQGHAALAVDFASKAAPYVHPRLQAIELDLKDIGDDELRQAAGERQPR